jgi:hypothetical protein
LGVVWTITQKPNRFVGRLVAEVDNKITIRNVLLIKLR